MCSPPADTGTHHSHVILLAVGGVGAGDALCRNGSTVLRRHGIHGSPEAKHTGVWALCSSKPCRNNTFLLLINPDGEFSTWFFELGRHEVFTCEPRILGANTAVGQRLKTDWNPLAALLTYGSIENYFSNPSCILRVGKITMTKAS